MHSPFSLNHSTSFGISYFLLHSIATSVILFHLFVSRAHVVVTDFSLFFCLTNVFWLILWCIHFFLSVRPVIIYLHILISATTIVFSWTRVTANSSSSVNIASLTNLYNFTFIFTVLSATHISALEAPHWILWYIWNHRRYRKLKRVNSMDACASKRVVFASQNSIDFGWPARKWLTEQTQSVNKLYNSYVKKEKVNNNKTGETGRDWLLCRTTFTCARARWR